MPSLHRHWQAPSQKPMWGQQCHIRHSPKYLKNIFPLIMEGMMPPDRARHFCPVWEGQVLHEQAPSPGPSLISCKYCICIALKKQTHRIATGRHNQPHQEERSEKIHTRDIEEVLEVPPCCYHEWPWPWWWPPFSEAASWGDQCSHKISRSRKTDLLINLRGEAKKQKKLNIHDDVHV